MSVIKTYIIIDSESVDTKLLKAAVPKKGFYFTDKIDQSPRILNIVLADRQPPYKTKTTTNRVIHIIVNSGEDTDMKKSTVLINDVSVSSIMRVINFAHTRMSRMVEAESLAENAYTIGTSGRIYPRKSKVRSVFRKGRYTKISPKAELIFRQFMGRNKVAIAEIRKTLWEAGENGNLPKWWMNVTAKRMNLRIVWGDLFLEIYQLPNKIKRKPKRKQRRALKPKYKMELIITPTGKILDRRKTNMIYFWLGKIE